MATTTRVSDGLVGRSSEFISIRYEGQAQSASRSERAIVLHVRRLRRQGGSDLVASTARVDGCEPAATRFDDLARNHQPLLVIARSDQVDAHGQAAADAGRH